MKMSITHASPSMSLSLLRPLALPRPSSLRRFLGIARASTTAATSSSATISSSVSSPSRTKPYTVLRTPSNNLPVYQRRKRGGNLLETKVQKIQGDVNTLRTELQEALGMAEKDVVVNPVTKAILIKVSDCDPLTSI